MASRAGIRKAVVSAAVGLGYGAVVGALVGAAFGLSLWALPNVRSNALGHSCWGALLGLCLGAAGGGVFGLFGSQGRGLLGWGLAGLLERRRSLLPGVAWLASAVAAADGAAGAGTGRTAGQR